MSGASRENARNPTLWYNSRAGAGSPRQATVACRAPAAIARCIPCSNIARASPWRR